MIRAAAVALLIAVVAGCGGGDATDGRAADVAACDDLRRRQNELIATVNQALAGLADATDDRARRDAIRDGFDALIATAGDQEVGEVEEGVRGRLVAGAEAAVAELEDERGQVLARHPDGVGAADEHGVAGELQNALEKAFSHLEPPRSAYRDVGLDEATDADPDCRFVTHRADPAG